MEAQNGLSLALLRLGEQKGDKACFESAAAVLSKAVEDPFCAQHPLMWAKTYTNLGVTFARLGKRELSPANLERAETFNQR
jgi:Tfp pilus assembly protein PilF